MQSAQPEDQIELTESIYDPINGRTYEKGTKINKSTAERLGLMRQRKLAHDRMRRSGDDR